MKGKPRKAPSLLQRITSRKAVVGVIGLGYVGLPLVRLFASRGFRVLGFDTDEAKVASLRRGRSYIKSIRNADLRKIRTRFEATGDFGRLPEADALLICVPTPLTPDNRPDLSHVRSTTQAIARHLRARQLVILESTTYPGTTREVLKPLLDDAGVPYHLAYSPEREDPGNRRWTTADIPHGVMDDSFLRLLN